MEKNSFNLIKDLSFCRVAGSEEEKKAIDVITSYIKAKKGTYEIEDFEIPHSKILECSLVCNGKSYEVNGFKRSGNINGTYELVILDDVNMIDYVSVKDKACLISSNLTYKFYEELTKHNVACIIDISGSLYDDINICDLEAKSLRDRHLKYGKIPCFTIRSIDAENIIASGVKEVSVSLKQEEETLTSHNIISEIKGDIEDEIICFCAHYDSVLFSKGAYDNATGSATIFELYSYYLTHKPNRTLRFIWFGAEEMGLLGSKAYIEKHKEDKIRLCINVDMTAVNIGKDICCVTGSEKIVNYIEYLSKEVGFNITVNDGVYSSDSTPFADNGIPSLSFARLSNQFGAKIHSNKDNGLNLSEFYFYQTINFIKCFADHMIKSIIFPIKLEMPEKMKKEIDKYYGRNI